MEKNYSLASEKKMRDFWEILPKKKKDEKGKEKIEEHWKEICLVWDEKNEVPKEKLCDRKKIQQQRQKTIKCFVVDRGKIAGKDEQKHFCGENVKRQERRLAWKCSRFMKYRTHTKTQKDLCQM